MKRLLNAVLFTLTILASHFSNAQSTTADSLRLAFKAATHDSTRCAILTLLIDVEPNDSIWPIYNEQLLKLAESNVTTSTGELKNTFSEYYASALNNSGYLSMQRGETFKAYEYYYKALNIEQKINNKAGIALEFVNLGYLFRQDGNISKALDLYHQALKLQIETNDKYGMATSYNNIGFIFDNQGEYIKALEYYNKSLDIYKKVNDKSGMATCYGNIAFLFETYGDPMCKSTKSECVHSGYIKAIDYLNEAIKIQEEINDKAALANSLNIKGGIYEYYGDPLCSSGKEICSSISKQTALDLYLKALKIRTEINNTSGVSQSYNSLAEFMLKQGKLDESLDYGKKCLNISKELGSAERIKDAALTLKKIYEKRNHFQEALNMYQLYIQMRDSIYNDESKKATLKKIFQIEYEKQATTDSVKNSSKIKEERLRNEIAISKQRYYTYGGFFGFALMLLVAIVIFKALKNKQKANIIITEQKLLSETQKHIIETKQKEIIDSITYAKRLQEAILPPKQFIDKHLPENFIFYKPKDLVAGDFYWAELINDLLFIAAADSTGHGVPGAMVSVVCSNALNRSIKEFHLTDTGKILDKARELVLETFEKGSTEVKDGMDISLLCIDKKNKTIFWSGANNPLWYIQHDEFKEIKADKQPIGKTDNPKPFTTHQIEFSEGTSFYLFTDGYADQFGGEKGKKFKYKQMSEMILRNKDLLLSQQKEIISETFDSWKGNLEQVDDVCIIGFKI
jgi:serine phosphatase RsbU (regulator of sigma subunit)/Tfp pilus assembly protein PilF